MSKLIVKISQEKRISILAERKFKVRSGS